MGYAIELYFDSATEQRIRSFWDALLAQGIDPLLPALGARPHVSLAVFQDLDPQAFQPTFDAFAADLRPFAVTLSALGTFVTAEGVVFLVVTPTQELLRVHQQLHDQLAATGPVAVGYYLPDQWVPHCTLATDLPAALKAAVLQLGQQLKLPIQGRFEGIELIHYRPVTTLRSRAFGLRAGPGS